MAITILQTGARAISILALATRLRSRRTARRLNTLRDRTVEVIEEDQVVFEGLHSILVAVATAAAASKTLDGTRTYRPAMADPSKDRATNWRRQA